MANLQKVVVVLLIVTLLLSAVSVVFNLMIHNIKAKEFSNSNRMPSNSGNIGFVVESSDNIEGDYGG